MTNRVGLLFSFAAGLVVYHFVLSDTNRSSSISAIGTSTTASLATSPIVGQGAPPRHAGTGQNRHQKSRTFSGSSSALDHFTVKTVARWEADATDPQTGSAQHPISSSSNNRPKITEVTKGGPPRVSRTIERQQKDNNGGATLAVRRRTIEGTVAKTGRVPLPIRAASARTWLTIAHKAARGEQGSLTLYPAVLPTYSSGPGGTRSSGWLAQRGARVGSTKQPRIKILSKRATANALSQKRRFSRHRTKWRKPYGLLGNKNVRRQRKKHVRRVRPQRKRAWINKVFKSSIQR